jgi:hypothetical protein
MALRTLIVAFALTACAETSGKRLVVPDDMKRPVVATRANVPATPTYQPTLGTQTLPARAGDAKPAAGQPVALPTVPSQRYVLRLADHGRIWEVELPETTGAYEVRIPLAGKPETPTAADQEILAGRKDVTPGEASKSYLGSLARIGELYGARKYELALIEAVDLEAQYPKDARLAAMKGSLFQKLGKPQLAKEAWQKALDLDPGDTVVAAALRGLSEE